MKGVKGCLSCSLYRQTSAIAQEYRKPFTPFTPSAWTEEQVNSLLAILPAARDARGPTVPPADGAVRRGAQPRTGAMAEGAGT